LSTVFKSNDIAISEILKGIDQGANQLPDFQRDWVWDDHRIRALIASISNSYPVGALMFLEFCGDTVRFKYRPFMGTENNRKPDMLVLDGQQRLTSVYGAMFCKNPVRTKTDKNKEVCRFYYLDIEKCLSAATDRIDAVISLNEDRTIKENFGRDITLDLSSRKEEFEQHMFPLNLVYDHIASQTWMDEYREYHNYDKELLQRLRQFSAEILIPIHNYKVPVITLEKNTPKDAVCQVFENVNTGGVSLTVFELVTASFAADNYELRKDWETRREEMRQKSDLLSEVSATDYLTGITLLNRYYIHKSVGEAVSCKKKDVLAITLDTYRQYADSLTDGFISAANFLKEQRIFTARDLPYTTQLIPLSVLFALLSSRAQDSEIKIKMSRWFWCGVLGEMYGGANETRFVNDITGVMGWISAGPEPDTVSRAYFQPVRLLTMQTRLSAAYKGVLALILKAGAVDFISGSDMGFTNFTEQAVDIHHIFPIAYSNLKYKRDHWNSVVNKTPLSARTNRTVGGSAPSDYLKKIEEEGRVAPENLDGFIKTHLIDVSDLRADNFEGYFIKRAKALLGLISQAMGKTISELGSEEVVASFGASLE